KYGSGLLHEGFGWSAGIGTSLIEKRGVIGPIGSATRLYNFNDFFIAKSQNMINNPVGIGIILSLLITLGIIFLALNYKTIKTNNQYKLITLLWFLFTFLGLFGGTLLPVALISFRFWMLLAIPASILASEAIWLLFAVGKSIKIKKWMILIALIVLIWFTSGQQKFAVNTAQWGPGGWLAPAPGGLNSFLWMKENFPIDTPVFVYSISLGVEMIGFNLYSCEWCTEVIEFKKEVPNTPVEETHEWLKNQGYSYAMIDEYYAEKNGLNETIKMMDDMISSNKFTLIYQPQYNGQKLFSFVFRIN
ncbi:hypothetical protein KY317_01905, partial [Candidatus Woesearchaeota archaeon]|nr:hypothetical protein [Candidatus Woesearchaeota archaeon]